MYQRILVATDGSNLSRKAVSSAIALASLCDAELVALKVAAVIDLLKVAVTALLVATPASAGLGVVAAVCARAGPPSASASARESTGRACIKKTSCSGTQPVGQ